MIDPHGGSNRLCIRVISASDGPGLDLVASLHMELLPFGTMAGLGHEFVREVCYRANMAEGALRVFLAEIDGEAAGFVAIAPHARTFHREGLSGQLGTALWHTAKALILRPLRLRALLSSLRELGSRREESDEIGPEPGEVVCIAVRPRFLAPRFMRESGIRASEALVRFSARYLRRAGVDRMRMLAGVDNKPVLMLYHLLGASFRDRWLGANRNVEVTFDLTDERLSGPLEIPAAWQLPPVAAAKDHWREYWEGIDDRKRVFRIEARDHVDRLRNGVPLDSSMRVLDFGCGFGFVAEALAPHVRSVALWDGAASVRRRARLRTAHIANVEFADLDHVAERYDVITVHSVVQYMSAEEIRGWLQRWRRMLRPGGMLVLSDLLQVQTSALRELTGYLGFALRRGFFWDALLQGIRETSRYWRVRRSRPLTQVAPGVIRDWGAAAGYRVELLQRNLSYRQTRCTAVLHV